ncbi:MULTISPECIES: peptidoglycan-binding domain-containing protein [unclassified Streptomyces]|uniref:peptidoglycan-binding domain-containing protein n=1 Tax=unclassified Streptomyces TaxID=2593676 RepID=UPI003328AE5E
MPTPEEPGKPHERPVLEPIRVLRPRNTDALAELFREMTEDATGSYEAVPVPREPLGNEDVTQQLPPVTDRDDRLRRERRPRSGRASGPPRAAVAAVAVLGAALVGFACALLLPGRGNEAAAQTQPSTPAAAPTVSAPATASADPDGAGTLREGDSGPEVTDLQQRLLRIPNVYDNGPTDGRYDTVLTEAVARFQLWYGIRGDETGVYGDDTRRDLESRTAAGA